MDSGEALGLNRLAEYRKVIYFARQRAEPANRLRL
jgi:hypothetical protein